MLKVWQADGTDYFYTGELVTADEDEFIPTEPELLPPKEETEEERNQRIWEAIQSVSQG